MRGLNLCLNKATKGGAGTWLPQNAADGRRRRDLCPRNALQLSLCDVMKSHVPSSVTTLNVLPIVAGTLGPLCET